MLTMSSEFAGEKTADLRIILGVISELRRGMINGFFADESRECLCCMFVVNVCFVRCACCCCLFSSLSAAGPLDRQQLKECIRPYTIFSFLLPIPGIATPIYCFALGLQHNRKFSYLSRLYVTLFIERLVTIRRHKDDNTKNLMFR